MEGLDSALFQNAFSSLTGAGLRTETTDVSLASCNTREVVVRILPRVNYRRELPKEQDGKIRLDLGPVSSPRGMGLQLLRLARVVAHGCEQNGGLWVHGALVEWQGEGVILAGPGGVGKSTAAGRLPLPWHALSDDMCLIAKSVSGEYQVHPWPTFSRVRLGDFSGKWDVQRAVPLRMICMLFQHETDRLKPLSFHQAVSELVDVSGQTGVYLTAELDQEVVREVNVTRFHNAVEMAREVPVYRLNISLKGRFWEEIERKVEELRS